MANQGVVDNLLPDDAQEQLLNHHGEQALDPEAYEDPDENFVEQGEDDEQDPYGNGRVIDQNLVPIRFVYSPRGNRVLVLNMKRLYLRQSEALCRGELRARNMIVCEWRCQSRKKRCPGTIKTFRYNGAEFEDLERVIETRGKAIQLM